MDGNGDGSSTAASKLHQRPYFCFFFWGGNHHRTNGDLLDLASSPGSLALTFQKRPWSLGVMEANVRAPEMSCILGYPIPIKSY